LTLADRVQDARQLLRTAGRRPAVAGHDLWSASGLETVLPETVILCLQRCTAADTLRARGIEVFCLAEHVGAQEVAGASSVDLLSHPATRDFCRRAGPLALLSFKPSERLAGTLDGVDALLLAGSLSAARSAENKLAFIDFAERARLRTPRWAVQRLSPASRYEELSARWGRPLVIQGARGNAGQRTWMVASQAELEEAMAVEGGRPVRVAEFVAGMPFTASAVAGVRGMVSWIEPCRQLTGIDWLTPVRLGSCGNVWGDELLAAAAGDVGEQLREAGDALSAAGYRGVYGVDFVLGPDGPVVIETNPRMVASLPLATHLEKEAGRPPMVLLTLMEGLGTPQQPLSATEMPPLASACQLIVHQQAGDDAEARLTRSGIYRLRAAGAPEFLRQGAVLEDVAGDDEALLLTRAAGEPLSPGKEFARVVMRGRAAATPGARHAVMSLRGRA